MYEGKEALEDIEIVRFLRDMEQLAQWFQWCIKEDQHQYGYKRAMDLMKEIHDGKYKSKSGVWVQFSDIIEEIKNRLEA